MNELIEAATAKDFPVSTELKGMSTPDLRTELARSLTLTSRHLVHMAMIWAELESRGEDLSDLRTGLVAYLPAIASGNLDAEAVIRFAGQPTTLRSIAALPIEQQRRIAHGEPVTLLTVNAQGEYESVERPAYTLTATQARLVFDEGRVRTAQEQQAVVESIRVREKRRRPAPGSSRVRYDASADVLRIGRVSATVGEVVAAIASAATDSDDADLASSVVVNLTEMEHRQLKVRAAEAGVPLRDLCRRLLLTGAGVAGPSKMKKPAEAGPSPREHLEGQAVKGGDVARL